VPVASRVAESVAAPQSGAPVRVGIGSGWLLSRLCVALAPLYASCGVGIPPIF
jgi:hypothetical protein